MLGTSRKYLPCLEHRSFSSGKDTLVDDRPKIASRRALNGSRVYGLDIKREEGRLFDTKLRALPRVALILCRNPTHTTLVFYRDFEKGRHLYLADKIFDTGVASRCMNRRFGTSKLGPLPWSDLFRPKVNVA